MTNPATQAARQPAGKRHPHARKSANQRCLRTLSEVLFGPAGLCITRISQYRICLVDRAANDAAHQGDILRVIHLAKQQQWPHFFAYQYRSVPPILEFCRLEPDIDPGAFCSHERWIGSFTAIGDLIRYFLLILNLFFPRSNRDNQ